MITLTLEENQILEKEMVIPNPSLFFKSLPDATELTIVIKTHDALYHFCPIRKTVPYLKSAEYSPDYWVGETYLPKGSTFIGGILPTSFMREMIQLISERSLALKGTYLWADLVTHAYAPLPEGWVLILHDHDLFVCQDGILRFSRLCYFSLTQELSLILRYLKRFGYEEEMPLTLLAAEFSDHLPPFIHLEIRKIAEFVPQGLTLQVPEIMVQCRLYTWPKKIRAAAYALTFLNVIGILYYGSQIISGSWQDYALRQDITKISIKAPLDETIVEAFASYRRLSKDQPNILALIRYLIPLIKDQAVATHLHWTRDTLTLHLELNPTAVEEQLWPILQSQFFDYRVTWNPQENEPLKGVLIIAKKAPERLES